ncbi:MAG: Gfo/Idh/MocA family oxidoreductase [Acidobacteria bacterium]|nr:Gfo/Idh/MocA family oxidoreductase [Acidobacteriota bacterium]
MNDTTRRTIIQGAAAAAVLNSRVSRVLGANERINIAVVGAGGRGTNHLQEYCKLPGARVAAVVDVNQAAQEKASALVERESGHKPKLYYDMREAYQDKEIDAVSIATPNHWHVLSALWAVQAGKDVYVEKPVSHNVWEGYQLVKAARQYKRIVQVGQQSRSIPHKMRAIQLLQEGAIGKIFMAKGLCYKRRKSIGHTPDEAAPAGVKWDIFLGPAPLKPFSQNKFKYNWHWFWDTGNGDIGNQGVHEMDIALWGLGKTAFPKAVVSTGGKYLYTDDQETPNTQHAAFDFADGTKLEFEVRGLLTLGEGGLAARGNIVGNLFFGSDGVLSVDGGGFQVYKGEDRKLEMDVKAQRGPSDTGMHMDNFLSAVRSRKHEDLRCDVETGALSAAYCHLANISYRMGRRLAIDADARRFVNDADANAMLTRKYRAPYVVPSKV